MSCSFAHDPSRAPAPPATASPSHPAFAPPAPFLPSFLPSGAAPPPRDVPAFAPLRVGGSRQRWRRALLRRRRATAAGLAVTAAALAATGAGGGAGGNAGADARAEAAVGAPAPLPPSRRQREARPVKMVSAPVRIADAATVRLLRRGDRVDVIASAAVMPGPAGLEESGPEARVVARDARVAEIPEPRAVSPDGGALVVLSVPRATATALAGASAVSRLAVTLC
ncbi:hypothetical protein AB0O07_21975 [Streptomyces sp. NPDC093085]|uniref:hypothetical protein n=1 Tax=Streptomyces sp. NPDC093085 TaxID=3155068 RepID=UPI00342472D0